MRILFTTFSGYGHFHPLVPLARALQQAGHEVAFACAESFRQVVEHNGFRHFVAGVDPSAVFGGELTKERMAQMMEQMMRAPPEALLPHIADMFVGLFAHRMVPDLLRLVSDWRPDLLVRDLMEFGACVVGEHLGIPCATLQVGAVRPREFRNALMTQSLDALRAVVGLPPDPQQEMLYRDLHLCFAPPSYLGDAPLAPTTHYLKTELFDQSGDERLPDWAGRLGAGGRPVVYASLGTVVNKLHGPLHAILAGLRDEPVDLVMTVGRDQDPAGFGPQPPHVHVERYIPQSLLLPRCDLAILHGGYNSVTSALGHGLPLVVVPIGADQPINAQRCQELGVGRVVSPLTVTPERIRDAVREVLATPSFREGARRFQREAEALPGVEHGVALLEKLVASKKPPRAMA
ncbi:glycosyltransferase [Archangium violaceum]|uniref:glycosyltransferase n=1 Tax=Archangium violaceum TaxID=83451 RepID=UPI0036DE4403